MLKAWQTFIQSSHDCSSVTNVLSRTLLLVLYLAKTRMGCSAS
jgi:hypothetical protein